MSIPRRLGFAVALLLATLLGTLLWWRQASLPVHAGTIPVAGAVTRIDVVRDEADVPHISAASEADALFALGFVHAQDRLWQLEFSRRVAHGRVAEIAGHAGVAADRFMRTLDLRGAAQRIVRSLEAETAVLLDAYAAGINAYLRARSGPLPPEFALSSAPEPAAWAPEDSIAVSLLVAWDLSSHNYRHELARLRLANRLSRAEIDEFRPPYPGDLPPAIEDYPEVYRALGLQKREAAFIPPQGLARWLHVAGDEAAVGSNNWVLAGTRTRSGKPLLANDPHLRLTAPGSWYFAHLQAPGLDVQGATTPGFPYVLIGRNRHVAWGFTNTGTDNQDLYLERVVPGQPERYLSPNGSEAFEVRTEVLQVKGADPLRLDLRRTRHGPVVSDALVRGDASSPVDPSEFVLALRWSALEPDRSLAAIRAMNRAVDAAALQVALRDFGLAMQNVVYADVHGTIGFVAAGRAPVRRADNAFAGTAPAPGWEERNDWTGWVPNEELPHSGAPASGAIVTANQKVAAPGSNAHLTYDWYLPYRVRRIESLLADTPSHDAASLARIQADLHSQASLDLIALLHDTQPRTEAGRIALRRLQAWDGRALADAPEPLILQTWLQRLRTRIYADDLGPLADDYVLGSELTATLLNTLSGATRARDWCDDAGTPNQRETCSELAAEALDDAVIQLGKTLGKDPTALRWGDVRRAVFEHRPFSGVPALRRLFERRIEVGGDTHTVNAGALRLRGDEPFHTRHGAALRVIWDLSDQGRDGWILAPGQSGHPFSDRYDDLLEPWLRGQLRPLRWQVATPRAHLRLVPAPR